MSRWGCEGTGWYSQGSVTHRSMVLLLLAAVARVWRSSWGRVLLAVWLTAARTAQYRYIMAHIPTPPVNSPTSIYTWVYHKYPSVGNLSEKGLYTSSQGKLKNPISQPNKATGFLTWLLNPALRHLSWRTPKCEVWSRYSPVILPFNQVCWFFYVSCQAKSCRGVQSYQSIFLPKIRCSLTL